MEYFLEYLSVKTSVYLFAGALIAEAQAVFFLFAALSKAAYNNPRLWMLFFGSNSAVVLVLLLAMVVAPVE
ncbi:MAG: hypothetical protein AB1781_01300 [Pseudomonadota bacterium]